MTRQAVTKHLTILEGANLVVATRRGRAKLHHINPAPSMKSPSVGSANMRAIG
jgi:predicted transcriptional regulator